LLAWLARRLAGWSRGKGGGWSGKASEVSRAIVVERGLRRGDGPRTWSKKKDKRQSKSMGEKEV